jgi:hypothetical protein
MLAFIAPLSADNGVKCLHLESLQLWHFYWGKEIRPYIRRLPYINHFRSLCDYGIWFWIFGIKQVDGGLF